MQYKKLGRTGLQVSEFAIGIVWAYMQYHGSSSQLWRAVASFEYWLYWCRHGALCWSLEDWQGRIRWMKWEELHL